MGEELLTKFEEGPYNILNYRLKEKNGKLMIEQNRGDLGRITLENIESVRKLRESLERAEEFFMEKKRRKKEL